MSLQIPNVTVDDLRDFHAKHFPTVPAPEHFLHSFEPETVEECSEEADDGLGYYSDGKKRTLTDEQIAMFRHSEIQAILRERKRKREDGEVSDDEGNGAINSPLESGIPASPSLPPAVSPSVTLVGPLDVAASESPDKVQTSQTEKPCTQRWATSSARTKARNKKHRDNHRAKKKALRLQKEQEKKNGHHNDENDVSDEWDPWHQANGPDAQKEDALDLDY